MPVLGNAIAQPNRHPTALRRRCPSKTTSSAAGENVTQSGAFGAECRSQDEGTFLLLYKCPSIRLSGKMSAFRLLDRLATCRHSGFG